MDYFKYIKKEYFFIWVYISSFCLSHVAILSIVGNLMVLLMAYKRSHHMKPPEYLSVNLALTDLGAAVTIYPLAVASAWNHHWIGGNVTCVYYGLMGFFFGAASMMTLTIMAIIRFIVSLTLQSPSEFPWALSLDLLFILTPAWICNERYNLRAPGSSIIFSYHVKVLIENDNDVHFSGTDICLMHVICLQNKSIKTVLIV